MVMMIIRTEGTPAPNNPLSTNNPVKPPTTMIPSKPMLMIPDLSENIPPKATNDKEVANINMYDKSNKN